MKRLSLELREQLELNPNVLNITEKSVTYTHNFKKWVLQQSEQGISAEEIFISAGIPVKLFPDHYCKYCVKRWKKKVKDEGLLALKTDGRGKGATGRPKSENLNDYTYEELLAIVEIQKEVIEDLKKKKALAKKKK